MKNQLANKHPKRILALKMQTPDERKIKGMYGSPYMSRAWELRRELKKKKLGKKKD